MRKIIDGTPSTMNDEYQLNLHKILQHAAKVHDEVEVISYRTLQGGGVYAMNYSMIYERVCKMANALEDLGINAKDHIAILGWNDHRYFESYFSVSGVGAVLVQLNSRLHRDELAYIVKHSNSKALFVDETLVPIAEALAEKHNFEFFVIMSDKSEPTSKLKPVYYYEELIKEYPKKRSWPEIDERSAATACYTQGTTGMPKGVFYSHRALILHMLVSANMLSLNPKDVFLQIVPFYHVNGWGFHFACPAFGVKLVLPGMYNPVHLANVIINEKVTIAPAAPAILIPMLEVFRRIEPNIDLRNLRLVSGANEPPLAMQRGYARMGAKVIHAYGATEATPLISINIAKPQILKLDEEAQWEHMKKQGLIIFGIEAKLVNPSTSEEIPWDGKSVGELWVRGPWVIKEYYQDPRSKESVTEDGWWRTGDAGTIDELGYFQILDRLKDLIKSGGEWISSLNLETTLMKHPYVLEAVVIGVQHPRWGERPLALVVLKDQYKGKPKDVIEKDLKQFLLGKFAEWQIPDRILFIDEIPRTSVGKINKRLLREKYRDYYLRLEVNP